MSRVVKTLFASVFSLVIWLPVALAQEAQDPGTTPSPTKKLDKETKRKMKRTLKELDNAYRQWLTEDVTYIISPEERNAFLQLIRNKERNKSIKAFCLARTTNPTLPTTNLKKSTTPPIPTPN